MAITGNNVLVGASGGGRADVGDAPQTNLVWHFRADVGITEATGVSAWLDQVAETYSLTQATSGNQPSYDATETVGTLANAGAMTFDGSNDVLESTDVKVAAVPHHIFVVWKPIGYTGGDKVITGASTAYQTQIFAAGGDQVYRIGAGAEGGDTTFTTGTWALLVAVNNGASSSLGKNADSPTGASITSRPWETEITLAAQSPTAMAWGNHAVAELLIYDLVLTGATTSKLSEVENYINDQYGLW